MVISDLWAAVILMAYYLVGGLAVIPTMLKAWSNLPKEVIRKIQHVVYSLSIFILLRLFSAWYVAVGAAFLLVLLAYPVLYLIERTDFYKKMFVDRTERGGGAAQTAALCAIVLCSVNLFVLGGLTGGGKMALYCGGGRDGLGGFWRCRRGISGQILWQDQDCAPLG